MIKFILNIDPVPKGRPRFTRTGHTYTPAKTRSFENAVRLMVRPYAPLSPLVGPLKLFITFYLQPPQRRVRETPTCRPDLDNLIKPVKDALNGIMWVDDSQITSLAADKVYDWANRIGSIAVTIIETV